LFYGPPIVVDRALTAAPYSLILAVLFILPGDLIVTASAAAADDGMGCRLECSNRFS
jgi:hypothetical protein